jgi:bifunctional non-homologous end joining protein LigD
LVEGQEESINYCLCSDEAALAWFINQGCIELHPWLSSVNSLSMPDFMVIDLDPSEGVIFSQVIEVAVAVKECLVICKLIGFPKTSGASGIHIYIPLKKEYSYAQVRKAANYIADLVVAKLPAAATVERTVSNRTGKVYVDYLQNVAGKTIASVYSVRPVKEASISMPVTWDEVYSGKISPGMFTLDSVMQRLKEKGDLFAPVLEEGFSLDHLL